MMTHMRIVCQVHGVCAFKTVTVRTAEYVMGGWVVGCFDASNHM